ncbi:serpin family protein [Cohnella boryungensis]|uniref:Serpin family protein n=1 Tax=Cohnella boryungensis TaxID=768479 RepID=A0ABV8S938_9BACL
MRIKTAGMLLGLALLCTGCGQSIGEPNLNRHPAIDKSLYEPSDVNPAVVQASNDFGLALFEELYQVKPDQNLFLSPISVSTALALLSQGANGQTREELVTTLKLGGMTKEEIAAGYRSLLGLLGQSRKDGGVLRIANSLWLREGKAFDDGFLTSGQINYGAELERVDFAQSRTLDAMNAWVAKSTEGHIPKMVEELDAEAAMYVLNAVYFSGAWTDPFQPGITQEGSFYTDETKSIRTSFMKRGGMFEYAEQEGFDMIRLTYGQEGDAYMAILLPERKPGAMERLVRKLASKPELLTEAIGERRGSIELPKVKLSYEANLEEPLIRLGLQEAFSPGNADFSGVAPEPPNLYISKVKHKSTLEMNEEGTIASAATEVEMLAGAAPPDNPFRMVVDRPFVTAIVDRATGCLLFAGIVNDPEAD